VATLEAAGGHNIINILLRDQTKPLAQKQVHRNLRKNFISDHEDRWRKAYHFLVCRVV